jgi:transcription antitermination factor NusG
MEIEARINLLRQQTLAQTQNTLPTCEDIFFPQCIDDRDRRHPKLIPLFSRYFFVLFDITANPWRKIYSTLGVKHLLGSGPETPTTVPHALIESIKSICNSQGISKYNIDGTPINLSANPVTIHSTVRITEKGRFEGKEGTCVWASPNRIAILLDGIFNRQVRAEFSRSQVALIG